MKYIYQIWTTSRNIGSKKGRGIIDMVIWSFLTKISKRVLGTRIGTNFKISPCVVMGICRANLFHGSNSNLREVHPLKFIEGYGAVFHKTMTGPATRFSIPHNADPCHPLSSHIATNLYFLSPSRSALLCSAHTVSLFRLLQYFS